MSRPPPNPSPARPERVKIHSPSAQLKELLAPSIQVGAGAGIIGLFVGAVGGIARSNTPALFSVVSGVQWFVLGSSYYASRQVVIGAWGGDERLSRTGKAGASAVAGGCAGFVGGLLRGPRNILPAAVVFSILGAGGQAVVNATTGSSRPSESTASWLASRWSPVTPLSDQQYERMLEEKILKLDAEVALVDDDIAALRLIQDRTEDRLLGP